MPCQAGPVLIADYNLWHSAVCHAGFRTDPEGLKCIPCPAGTVASLPGSGWENYEVCLLPCNVEGFSAGG